MTGSLLIASSTVFFSLAARDWLSVGFIAIFGTLIPMLVFLEGLKRVSALRGILIMTLEPVLASGFAWLLLSESLNTAQAAGGVLIVVAVVSIQVQQARSLAISVENLIRRHPCRAL